MQLALRTEHIPFSSLCAFFDAAEARQRAGQDLLRPRNMVIVALIIIFGVGGMQVSIGGFKLAGIGLAAITGVVLNLLLPQDDPQG